MKSFFVAMTKLIGLYSLIQCPMVAYGMLQFSRMPKDGFGELLLYGPVSFLLLGMILALACFLLFRAETIARWLKINEETFPGALKSEGFLQIGLVLMGVYFLVAVAPRLVINIWNLVFVQRQDSQTFGKMISFSVIDSPLVTVLLAFLLILFPAKVISLIGRGDRWFNKKQIPGREE